MKNKKNEPVKNRKITKKEFGYYLQVRNFNTITTCYNSYLLAVNKPLTSFLTAYDIYRVDGVYID